MADLDLDAAAALLDAATPLPWDGHHHLIFEPLENTPDGEAGAEVADVDHPEDTALIVAAVNALPALVAAVRWAQGAPHHDGCGEAVGLAGWRCTCGRDEALKPFGGESCWAELEEEDRG